MISKNAIQEIAVSNHLDPAMFMAFIEVESGGRGFDAKTGKLIIQFEPSWFRKKAPYAPSGKWSLNKVDVQSKEWEAFNDAFRINPNAAMESTSIGLPQIMGFHYKRLGYRTVGDMWDDFKKGEVRQVSALARFILTDKNLHNAIQQKDFHKIASVYNGSGYMQIAKKYGREPYNISLEKAFKKYLKTI
ncbi:MAG: N-acetylmuramidase family protein [Chitinophagales bacterium]|nr:N-acetylmuramidase family protein [Chitinophagales bacterium]